MPAGNYLEVYKFCRQVDATLEEVKELPSGNNIAKASQKISLAIQVQLRRELETSRIATADVVGARPSADPGVAAQEPETLPPQAGTPVTKPAPQAPTGKLLDTTDAVAGGSNRTADSIGQVEARDLARECQRPTSSIISILKAETGRDDWTPNDMVSARLAERVLAVLKKDAPGADVRRAGAAKVAKLPRSVDELNEARICVLSEKLTPGEKYLAQELRKIVGCIAFVGPHAPKEHHAIYGQSIEIDAIVMTPTFLAVIEVKDTTATGKISPAMNGTWMVGDRRLHDGNSFPTDQVLRQAKVLKTLMNGLSGLHRIPGFVVIHGETIYFAEQPFEVVAPGECFASKSTDIVAAIEKYQTRSAPRITVAKVQRVMDALMLGLPQRLNRQELGLLGYLEDANAIN